MGQTGLSQAVREAISTIDQKETEELLSQLISIESHHEEQAVASFIVEWLNDQGIEAWLEEVLPNRPNVIAKISGKREGPSLVLNGHLDTVPPYEMKSPFAAVVRDGRLYGRGSVDMKGALAAMLMTLVALKRSDRLTAGSVYFAGTVGEETYSPGAWYLANNSFTADYAIVGEPTGLKTGVAHKGVAWYEAEFPGVTAHGSVPEQGVNAIYRASRWITYLQDNYLPQLKTKSDPLLGSPSLNIGMIEGGTRPVIVPGMCKVKFERRLIPGESGQSALAELQETLQQVKAIYPDFDGSVKEMDNFHGVPHGPLQTPVNGKLPSCLTEAFRYALPEHAETEAEAEEGRQDRAALPEQAEDGRQGPIGLQFWTDGALLQSFCKETVVCGPGHIAQAHSDEEYIELEQLHAAVYMYTRAALVLCVDEGDAL